MVEKYFISSVSVNRRFIFGILFFGFFLSSFTSHAFAQSDTSINTRSSKQGIEVNPAYIDVDLSTKSSQEEVVLTYTNHTSQSVSLELFPIDFRPTDEYGGIGFAQSNSEYLYSLSSYLSFESNRLDLEPGETKQFVIVARNRLDLTPGGHYAAVVARVMQLGGEETVVSPAVSSLIFLRKTGGESYNLSLQDLSWPPIITTTYKSTVTGLFQNEGNTHLIPTGTMRIRDMFGRVLFEGPLNEAFVRVLPSSKRFVPVYLRQIHASLPFSINSMTIEGSDSLKKVTYLRTDVFIYIHPLLLIFLIICVVIGVVALYRGRRKRSVGREILKNSSIRTIREQEELLPTQVNQKKRIIKKRRKAIK